MHALMETGCTWYTSSNDHSSEWQRLRSQLLSRHCAGATALHTLHVQPLLTEANSMNWKLWLLPWVTGNFQHAGIKQTALIAAFKPPFRWVHELRAAITAAIAASVSPPWRGWHTARNSCIDSCLECGIQCCLQNFARNHCQNRLPALFDFPPAIHAASALSP